MLQDKKKNAQNQKNSRKLQESTNLKNWSSRHRPISFALELEGQQVEVGTMAGMY